MATTNEQSANEISIDVDESCDLQTEDPFCMIKRVQKILVSVEANKNCFAHLLITLGPYQVSEDNPNLDRGMELKISLMGKFLNDPSNMYSTEGIQTLPFEMRKFYTSDATKDITDLVFANMMLLDGCAILQFISCFLDEEWSGLNIQDYEKLLFINDLFLLENQIPFLVLKQLMSDEKLKELCNEFIKKVRPDREAKSSKLLKIAHSSNNDKTNQKPNPRASTDISVSLSHNNEIPTNYDSNETSHTSTSFNRKISGHHDPNDTSNTSSSRNPENPSNHNPNEIEEASLSDNQTNESSVHCDPNEAAHTSTNHSHNNEDPLHLLDMLWKHCSQVESVYQPLVSREKEDTGDWFTFRSAKELKAAGILFSHSETSNFYDVKYMPLSLLPRSYLSLPRIIVDYSIKSLLLNLAAYEMTSSRPNSERLVSHNPNSYQVSSYLCLMASLIDDAEDVAILRRSGIILNCLGSDQQVANLFNDVAQHLVSSPKAYRQVKGQIEQHYSNQVKLWINEVLHTHFRSPWTLLAFIVAIIVIFNTVVQTIKALRG